MSIMAVNAVETPAESRFGEWADRHSGRIMVLPAVLILLVFAIFPLIISAYLSLSRFALAAGSFKLTFIGLYNYKRLLTRGAAVSSHRHVQDDRPDRMGGVRARRGAALSSGSLRSVTARCQRRRAPRPADRREPDRRRWCWPRWPRPSPAACRARC